MSEQDAQRTNVHENRPRRSVKAIALFIGAVILVGAHTLAAGEPGLVGPQLLLDHVFNLALVTVLLALCLGVGLVILTRLSLIPVFSRSSGERAA